MKYFDYSDEYSICDEVATAVQDKMQRMSEDALEKIRNSNNNVLELSFSLKDLGITVPEEKIWKFVSVPFTTLGSGRFVIDNIGTKPEISNGTITVRIGVFDTRRDSITVCDDQMGIRGCVRMSNYSTFDAALDAAYEGTSNEVDLWLEKEA